MATEMEMFESPDQTPLDFCLWGLDKRRNLQEKVGYTRRIASSHFGFCCCIKKW